MSYLGKTQLKSSDIQRFDVTSSTSATHVLSWTAPNEQSLIITINGVKQQDDAYSIAGSPTTVTLTDALITTDKLEIVGIVDVGTMNVPGVGSVQTDQLADDAVTADKLANSINTEIAANTAKVTNATHTGDVTGATALTIANDAVDIAMLSATGTADATTFLRGDNAWAAAGGVLQVVSTAKEDTFTTTGSSFVDITGFSVAITPASSSNKVLVLVSLSCGGQQDTYAGFKLLRGVTTVAEGDTDATAEEVTFGTVFVDVATSQYKMYSLSYSFLDSPSTTSATTYKVQVSPMRTTSRTFYLNRNYTVGDANQMVSTSTITVMEIAG